MNVKQNSPECHEIRELKVAGSRLPVFLRFSGESNWEDLGNCSNRISRRKLSLSPKILQEGFIPRELILRKF